MLKAFVESLDGVDAKYHDLYEKVDGGFALKVDEKGYKAKLSEFRERNVELNKTTDELRQQAERFKGIDPDKYAEAVKALDILDKSEEGKLLKDGKYEDVFKKRTESLRNGYEQRLTDMQKTIKQLQDQSKGYFDKLASLTVETRITNAVTELGVPRKGALTDIIGRAKSDWSVDENGELKLATGKVDKDGNPLDVNGWAKTLLSDAPYLFESQQGGGATGGRRSEPSNGRRSIPASELSKNLEAVASGKLSVDVPAGE